MPAHRVDSTGREVILEIGADAVTPCCDVYRTTDLAAQTAGANNALNFEAAALNEDTMWVVGTPSRVTAKRPGYYFCAATVTLSVGGSDVHAALRVNGTTISREVNDTTGASGYITLNVEGVVYLNAADYVEVITRCAGSYTVEGDASTSTIGAAAGFVTRLAVMRIGPSLIVPSLAGGGSMALIADQTLGSAAATITFSSIPQTYNHLLARVMGRGDGANAPQPFMRINGDTGTNYETGGTGGATACQLSDFFGDTRAAPSGGTALEVEVSYYSNTSFWKSIKSMRYGTGAIAQMSATGTLIGHEWKSTVGVNQLSFYLSSGNFVVGSRATLYGVL